MENKTKHNTENQKNKTAVLLDSSEADSTMKMSVSQTYSSIPN